MQLYDTGRKPCWNIVMTHIFDASPTSLTCFLLAIFSFPDCGGNIYINDFNPSGYTTSPNYPDSYPPHVDCVWTITAPNGHAVELQFEDQFYIEPSQKYISTLFCLCFSRDFILIFLSVAFSNSSQSTLPDLQSKGIRKFIEQITEAIKSLVYIPRTLQHMVEINVTDREEASIVERCFL